MNLKWRGEGGQHQGARPYQEDSWALRRLADGSLLAVVADGMGGHAGGAVASKVVLDAFLKTVEGGRSLADGLGRANEAVKARAAGHADLNGMGSTLVAARVKDDRIVWISVGDSPLYLVQNGRLERLNADHSMAPQIDELARRGVITEEQAADHPGRHTLREAVMGEAITLVDEGERLLPAGSRLLVCSDGVESLAHDRIAVTAALPVSALIDAVLGVNKTYQDNITVIKLDQHA
jgi:protein phosphatase